MSILAGYFRRHGPYPTLIQSRSCPLSRSWWHQMRRGRLLRTSSVTGVPNPLSLFQCGNITPLIITYNEEANIARTLDRLVWAHRVVVIDSGSPDKTLEIVRSYPQVELSHREFDDFASTAGCAGTQTPEPAGVWRLFSSFGQKGFTPLDARGPFGLPARSRFERAVRCRRYRPIHNSMGVNCSKNLSSERQASPKGNKTGQ